MALSRKHPLFRCWELTYRMFGLQPPIKPSVGGFWTRLVFLPLWIVLLPVYWLVIAAPVILTVLLVGFFSNVGDPWRAHCGLAALGFAACWTALYFMSGKQHRRDAEAQMPGVYHVFMWWARALKQVYDCYAELCEQPMDIESDA